MKTRTWGVSETGLRDWEGGRVESNEESQIEGAKVEAAEGSGLLSFLEEMRV